MIDVKFKKLTKEAVIPTYAHEGDAGLDLTATSKKSDKYGNIVYGTSIALEIPKNYVGLIFHRSGIFKKTLIMSNCVGVIDSIYRGEIFLKMRRSFFLKNLLRIKPFSFIFGREYKIGEKIGQLIILPAYKVNLIEVNELSETERGEGGFGSTGK